MKAYASLLAEDCDWVNIVGMHWHSKQTVMKAHTVYLSTMFLGVRPETLESEISTNRAKRGCRRCDDQNEGFHHS
jgi:hypothetical protein